MGFTLDEEPTIANKPARVAKSDDATVVLRGIRISLNSDIGGAFVTDCARNRERLFSDDQIREKYDIPETDWTEITKNKPLRLAINSECERRMLNNDAAREGAAKEFTRAPSVLGKILDNEQASPRHRIEAAKELRATAHGGTEKTGDTADRIRIVINLGADTKPFVIDAPVKPTPPNEVREISDAE